MASERGIAHVAAVPVGLAVHFDGGEERGQAGRCEHGLDAEFGPAPDALAAAAHVRGRDEELEVAAAAHGVEIDGVAQDGMQGVVHGGVGVHRCEQGAGHVPGHLHRTGHGTGRAGSLTPAQPAERALA